MTRREVCKRVHKQFEDKLKAIFGSQVLETHSTATHLILWCGEKDTDCGERIALLVDTRCLVGKQIDDFLELAEQNYNFRTQIEERKKEKHK